MSAADVINCDKARYIGFQIQKNLGNVLVSEAKTKMANKITTLDSLYNEVKLPAFFNRLVALAQQSHKLVKYLEQKFAAMPPSLFNDGYISKTDKPAFGKVIISSESEYNFHAPNKNADIVLDGGAFLRKVK